MQQCGSEGRPRRTLFRVVVVVVVVVGAAFAFALCGASVACGQSEPSARIAPIDGASAAAEGSAAAPMSSSEPLSIEIPTLGITAAVMELGLRPDGTMDVPPGAFPAGWYTGAPTPGELGPAILAGHVNWKGKPGVFAKLHAISPGDPVAVHRRDGSTALFRVDEVARYPKKAFPVDLVYGNIDHAGLRLITCGGDFDDQARSYVDNIVVYASLVGAVP